MADSASHGNNSKTYDIQTIKNSPLAAIKTDQAYRSLRHLGICPYRTKPLTTLSISKQAAHFVTLFHLIHHILNE